jgi:UDP:flavonoid glycosyltransferase YjiC (YdhE family)
MVVLPLFWDQHDNAQRVDETGFGARVPTYTFDDRDLAATIDRLLADVEVGRRLDEISARLRRSPGNERAADLIERLAATGEPVLA